MKKIIEQKLREKIRKVITKKLEGKLTEDYKNSEWEVYLRDEKGREKIVKKAKSKRAATILYNKIIKSDDYYEVGMRVIKEGKLSETIKKVSDAEDGAGFRQDWIGIYKGKFIQFKANFPVDAKKHTINYFKVPKSKYSEVVVISKKEYDVQQKLKVEGKLTENKIYSKKDGLKIVKKLQAKDKKIYKVDKQKATYDGKKVLMYNLYTKDKAKYSGNNLHGLDMARNSKGEAMYLVPIQEGGREIAKTILQQLGGNKFIAMTGAKNLGFTDKGLQMQIGRNSKGVTHVIIELDRGKDLYNIEFVQVRKFKRKTIKKLKGIYADQLGEIFTRYTGLRIRL